MNKKVIILVFLYIGICIFGIFVLLNDYNNKINENKNNSSIDNKVYNYHDEYINWLKYNSLFYYLCYNTNYDDVLVTNNYKMKHKDSLSEIYKFKQYNTEIYNYDIYSYNQMLTTVQIDSQDENIFRVDLLILKEPYADHPLLNKEIYFKYKLDKNGYVDDIEFIKEEVFREDDGTPIIRPNARKFDNQDYYYANYFENLVLGIDLIKFNYSCSFYDKERPIEDIEWEMKEYALTNNLRNRYDLNKGLVPDIFKEKVYKNNLMITFNYANNYFSYEDDFPKEKMATVPVYLYFNDECYNYLLSYTITEDGYLDNISLEEE